MERPAPSDATPLAEPGHVGHAPFYINIHNEVDMVDIGLSVMCTHAAMVICLYANWANIQKQDL